MALTLVGSDLLEERAIIYGRLGWHDEAIFILSNCLLDFEAAENHCRQFFGDATATSGGGTRKNVCTRS